MVENSWMSFFKVEEPDVGQAEAEMVIVSWLRQLEYPEAE